MLLPRGERTLLAFLRRSCWCPTSVIRVSFVYAAVCVRSLQQLCTEYFQNIFACIRRRILTHIFTEILCWISVRNTRTSTYHPYVLTYIHDDKVMPHHGGTAERYGVQRSFSRVFPDALPLIFRTAMYFFVRAPLLYCCMCSIERRASLTISPVRVPSCSSCIFSLTEDRDKQPCSFVRLPYVTAVENLTNFGFVAASCVC